MKETKQMHMCVRMNYCVCTLAPARMGVSEWDTD